MWLQVTKWSDFAEMPSNQEVLYFPVCVCMFLYCMLAKNSSIVPKKLCWTSEGEKKSITGSIFLE